MKMIIQKGIGRYIRHFSMEKIKRPPFHEVFPQKKMINKLLFELDSRLTFSKLYPIYRKIYENMDQTTEIPIPDNVSCKDIMIMKKVLEKVRHITKSVNKNLLRLENEILDKAAEMGDNDAVSLLAFDVLKNPSMNTKDDVCHAKKLIKELYQRRHPLTIKLTGDLAFNNGDNKTANDYYLKLLQIEQETFLAGEVYGKMGQILLQNSNLLKAEEYFLKCIKLCPIDYSVHSYYYLGQMYMNSDPFKARALIESCATQGFKESFKTLGFLEMNYFNDLYKALEWFRLGMELFEIECFVGYFDCSMKLQDYKSAKKCFTSMEFLVKNNKSFEPIFHEFVQMRRGKIKDLEEHSTKIVDILKNPEIAKDHSLSNDYRWNS